MFPFRYEVDEISPEQGIYDEDDYDYEILSKLTKFGREAKENESDEGTEGKDASVKAFS